MKIIEYIHHGNKVKVREDLKGKHVDHCLCYSCDKFVMETKKGNCHIANAVYDNYVEYGLVTPVYECPEYQKKMKEMYISCDSCGKGLLIKYENIKPNISGTIIFCHECHEHKMQGMKDEDF